VDREFIMETIEEIYDLLGEWEDLQEEEELDEDFEDLDDLEEDILDEDELEEALDVLKEAYSLAKTKGYYKVKANTAAAKKRFGDGSMEGAFLSTKSGKTIFIPTAGRKKKRGKGKTVSFKSSKAKKWGAKKMSKEDWATYRAGSTPKKRRESEFEQGMSDWGSSVAPTKKKLKKAAKTTRRRAKGKRGKKAA